MEYFHSNPRCGCLRCRLAGLMAPTVLITLGILFLLQEVGVRHFNQTWPILLIVIGLALILKRSASTEGHVERGYETYAMPAPPPQPPAAPTVTPTPTPKAGDLPPASGSQETHNG
jgi:hypothetical protein